MQICQGEYHLSHPGAVDKVAKLAVVSLDLGRSGRGPQLLGVQTAMLLHAQFQLP